MNNNDLITKIEAIEERLTRGCANILGSMGDLQMAQEYTINAKRDLAEGETRILAEHAENPKALGANEEARKASIATTLAEEQKCLDLCLQRERLCRNKLSAYEEVYKNDRDLLRVCECLTRLVVGE